jgi:hypothetical protein
VSTTSDLEGQAREFATDLTATLRDAFGPHVRPLHARALQTDGQPLVSVRQSPDTGIPLTVGGDPVLTLTMTYQCVWDTDKRFLAVNASTLKVYPGSRASGEPLFRYEYVRDVQSDQAGAHMHVHAHRDALTYVMTRCGSVTRSGKALREQIAEGKPPTTSQLHFPVGGARFRPCQEDILDMLVRQFGLDARPGWRESLAQGRERWRRTQTAAAVRDAPGAAVATLRRLGYEVRLPVGVAEPADNFSRLHEL